MRYDDIPTQARPLEVAVLLFFDPQRNNKKEAACYAHCSVRTVQKVVQKFEAEIYGVDVPTGVFTRVQGTQLRIITRSSFTSLPS